MSSCLVCHAPCRGSRCPEHRLRNGSTYAQRKRRKQVLAMNGGRCVYCGAPAEHEDHRVPLVRGGADVLSNLQPTCADCNLRKGGR